MDLKTEQLLRLKTTCKKTIDEIKADMKRFKKSLTDEQEKLMRLDYDLDEYLKTGVINERYD